MAAQKGRSILLKISDGVSPAGWTTISGIRSTSLSINNDSVDITTADEAPIRTLMADTGLRSVSVSGSGVFKDDAGMNSIEDLAMNSNIQEFQLVFGNSDIMQGNFQVTSYEYTGEHTGEQTFSISLESASIISMIRA